MSPHRHAFHLEPRVAEVADTAVLFHRKVVVQSEHVEVPLDPPTRHALGDEKVHHVVLVDAGRVFEVSAHGVDCENSFLEKVFQFYVNSTDLLSIQVFTLDGNYFENERSMDFERLYATF